MPLSSAGPVGGGEIGAHEVELGDVAVVGAVAEQDDQQQIVARELLADLGNAPAHVLGASPASPVLTVSSTNTRTLSAVNP